MKHEVLKAYKIWAHSIAEEVQGRLIKEEHVAHDWDLLPLRPS
jgi:hypothetical protein